MEYSVIYKNSKGEYKSSKSIGTRVISSAVREGEITVSYIGKAENYGYLTVTVNEVSEDDYMVVAISDIGGSIECTGSELERAIREVIEYTIETLDSMIEEETEVEEADEEAETVAESKLHEIISGWWTRLEDLVKDLESAGFGIISYNAFNTEYMVIDYEENLEYVQVELRLSVVGTTITVTSTEEVLREAV